MSFVEIDGVVYEVKQRSRYSLGFYYCGKCAVWWREANGRAMDRCPTCKMFLRRPTLKEEKKYISLHLDENEGE